MDQVTQQQVARTSLSTKLDKQSAEMLVDIVVKAVQCIRKEGEQLDLHMVEIMSMIHKHSAQSRFVEGLVLDHGGRHSEMPEKLKNCHILILNVSLEYENTEVLGGFYFSSAEQREKLIMGERRLVEEKCMKIIELKRKVCEKGGSFVIVNQKGIDPISLKMFADEGILALRRAKRRNMERLMLMTGGLARNSVEGLSEEHLG